MTILLDLVSYIHSQEKRSKQAGGWTPEQTMGFVTSQSVGKP